MSANSFGQIFKIQTFGESHGVALGVLIEGCPAGLEFDFSFLQTELQRRKPGLDPAQSSRKESDQAEVLSGVFEGRTLGTPIAIIVRNEDARSVDYETIKTQARVGHADDVWRNKFHHSDHRGGGRSSGRETLARVMAGAVAKMLLKRLAPQLQIFGYSSRIGPCSLTKEDRQSLPQNLKTIDQYSARFPAQDHRKVQDLLLRAKESGESYGGEAEILVKGMAPNLGQPVFHKLKADLAFAMMGVGATDSFSTGDENFDSHAEGTVFHHPQNTYGGIRGGISTGGDLHLCIGFKPTSSILDVAKKGRHDPCIVPRAVPVLEAMTALVIVDHLLWSRLDRV